jgi:hypothetical protein
LDIGRGSAGHCKLRRHGIQCSAGEQPRHRLPDPAKPE